MSSGKPQVSVIIPCYNGEAFIEDAVKSVLAQTYAGIEIILVDDGSSDGSGKILEMYSNIAKATVIRHETNLGIPAARNSGIRVSNGDYIAFLDQDDYWMPHKIERQVGVFSRADSGGTGLVFSGYDILDESGRRHRAPGNRVPRNVNSASKEENLRAFFMRSFIPIVTSVVRRECFETIGLLDESITSGGDDYEFCLRLLKRYDIAYCEEALAVRRIHGQNYTNASLLVPDAIRVIEAFTKEVPEIAPLKKKRIGDLLCDLGSYYSMKGQRPEAKKAYARSIRSRMFNMKSLAGYILSSLGPAGDCVFKLWFSSKRR